MTTIREQDGLTVFREGVYLSRAARDRRTLLAVGDALAEAARMVLDEEGDVRLDQWHDVHAAIAAWKAATG